MYIVLRIALDLLYRHSGIGLPGIENNLEPTISSLSKCLMNPCIYEICSGYTSVYLFVILLQLFVSQLFTLTHVQLISFFSQLLLHAAGMCRCIFIAHGLLVVSPHFPLFVNYNDHAIIIGSSEYITNVLTMHGYHSDTMYQTLIGSVAMEMGTH